MNPVAVQEYDAVTSTVARAGGGPGFVSVVCAVVGVILWCVAWYWGTASEIALIWWRSDTFAHGLIVLPVFAWLIWGKREEIGGLIPEPVPWLVLPVAGAGFLWLLGQLVSVAAAAHAGFVLMMVIGLVAVLGWRLARVLMFPLAFLLFGIPVGEFLLPTLMNFTAEFTVGALRMTGIPVYQEGLHFVIPNGRWSVVEACSGIRYLIASVMVGSLYAYLNYASARKRALFMLVAIIVPILANWLRAYMIVMIGYLTDNELAAGVDHLIYGWVFFGVVILAMFWIGRFWSDVPHPARSAAVAPAVRSRARWFGMVPVAVVIAFFPPVLAHLDAAVAAFEVRYALPAPATGWVASDAQRMDYRPHYIGARGEAVAAYLDANGGEVLVYSAFFEQQREGAEMVTWGNGLVPPESKLFNVLTGSGVDTALGRVRSAEIIGPGGRFAVAHWYVVNGRILTREWEVKLRLAADRLGGQSDASMVYVLATPIAEGGDGLERLRAFVAAHGPALVQLAAEAGMGGRQ